MRVTCDRCLRRYDVPDAALKGRKIRARCKCGARILVASSDGGPPPESAPESKGRPTRWFVDITSWEPITMDSRQLVRAFAAGRIDADTLIWCKGMPDWRRLRDVDELAQRLLAAGPSAGLRSSRPLSSRPLSSRPPERASELPPPVAPSRSRTPQASYYVPSAGDTMPLLRVPSSDPPASEASASVSDDAKSPSLLDELQRTSSTAPGGDSTKSGFATELELDASEAPIPATLEITPEAAGAEPLAAVGNGGKPPSNDGKIAIGGRDVSAALAEAALFATPDSVRPVSTRSEAGSAGASASGASSKVSLNEPPLSQPAASQPAASQPAASQTAAARGREGGSAAAEPSPRRSARNRRRSSSEETPAQKPSSLSVPPRAARSHRGRALVAVCGTLALIWFVGRATMEQSSKPVAVNEVPSANEPSAPLEPVGPSASPRSNDAPAPASAGQRAEQHAARQTEQVPEVEARPLQPPQAQATSALQPAQAPKVDAKPAPAPPAAPATLSAKPAPVAAVAAKPPPARTVTPAPARTAPALTPAAVAPAAAAARVATAAVQPPAKPGPFDMERAEQQMMMAAQAAASCGQAGPQRGAGQVKVLVEPWGRVVRVTHLEQGFVGTPVGICVMQAYQQLQVSPFEGGTRSLIGSFYVK
jgi:hypothetical protein